MRTRKKLEENIIGSATNNYNNSLPQKFKPILDKDFEDSY